MILPGRRAITPVRPITRNREKLKPKWAYIRPAARSTVASKSRLIVPTGERYGLVEPSNLADHAIDFRFSGL
jgi:hypothetical protein